MEQLQSLLEDAQTDEASRVVRDVKCNDLGFCSMHLINIVCSIPSVSPFRTLSSGDDAFRKTLDRDHVLFLEICHSLLFYFAAYL
jgi:hypothetical protein